MSELADAHIALMARIRSNLAASVGRIWNALPGHDREDIPTWLHLLLPVLLAHQRQASLGTQAYISRLTQQEPLGLDPDPIIAGIRGGVTPEDVYQRPFVTLWTDLKEGKGFPDANKAALERATSTAETDTQLAMTHTLRAAGEADDLIVGFQRVPDATACEFCRICAGQRYKTYQLMPLHNRCIAGDSVVWVPPSSGAKASHFGGAHAATRRWYRGEVVVIKTAAAHELTVTPNHPILTDRGWVAAGLLREGDSVISGSGLDRIEGRIPHEQDMPTRIEDCFRAGAMRSLVSMPFTPEQFHGDRGDGEVSVVPLHGGLDARSLAALLEPSQHLDFTQRTGDGVPLACSCGGRQRRRWIGTTTFGGMRCRGDGFALSGGTAARHDYTLLTGAAFDDPCFGEVPVDHIARDTVSLGEGQDRLTGRIAPHEFVAEVDALRTTKARTSSQSLRAESMTEGTDADADSIRRFLHGRSINVELDCIVECDRRDWGGHVYNLVTRGGWYVANGIITHNCGCGVDVITESNRHQFTGNPKNDLRITEGDLTVAIREHGEIGPVITDAADHFTPETALPAPATP